MREVVQRHGRVAGSAVYQGIVQIIEGDVLAGRLKPGDGVGTEFALCERFGANRSTVREAIRALEQDGLIERGADRRLYASLPRYNGLASRMSRALVLHEITFRELWATARILEVASAEAAATRCDAATLAALERVQEEAEGVADDPERLAEVDSAFHAALSAAAGNRVMDLAREPAALLFFPTTEFICRHVPEGAPRLLAAHRHLVVAIRTGDVAAARIWMERHVADWRRGFERAGGTLDEPVERVFTRHGLKPPF